MKEVKRKYLMTFGEHSVIENIINLLENLKKEMPESLGIPLCIEEIKKLDGYTKKS